MKANRTNDFTSILSTDPEQRDVRALTEYLTVLPDAPDPYTVVSQSGASYTVDAREDVFECPDYQYRGVHCKHFRRVAYATGERPIPTWIEAEEVDDQFGAHVDATPRAATSDAGAIVDDDDGDAEANDRPEDCG